MFQRLRCGDLPPELSEMLSSDLFASHQQLIGAMHQAGRYPVHGLDIQVPPGLYHPHPASSSAFILRTLLRERRPLGRLLELGCGTGVLGLVLLAEGLARHAVLVDRDPMAVEASLANARRAPPAVAAAVEILQGDLFAPVSGRSFDTVLFNLPLMHDDHAGEHHPALDDTAGALARRFFAQVLDHLDPGGWVYFSYSNLSSPRLLADFGERAAVELVAGEWVADSGFWLLVYRARRR